MIRVVTFVGAAVLVAACGGAVKPEASSGAIGTSDAGATGGVGGGASGGATAEDGALGGTTAVGGAGGTVTAEGGSGHSCVQTFDRAMIDIPGYEFAIVGSGGTRETTVQGRVTESTLSGMAIDSCPAFADCAPNITNVSVVAPGVDLSRAIPAGSLVSVHYKQVNHTHGPVTDIAITSLDAWGGYTNPTPAKSGLYLAVDDGGGSLPEFPFQVARILLRDCPEYRVTGVSCGGGETLGLYALRFDEPSGNSVQLWMGVRSTYTLGAGTLSVQVLRSYYSGGCGAEYNWGYWVANAWE